MERQGRLRIAHTKGLVTDAPISGYCMECSTLIYFYSPYLFFILFFSILQADQARNHKLTNNIDIGFLINH